MIDPVPGVSQFIPLETPQDSPANQGNILQGLTQDDLATIHRKDIHSFRLFILKNLLSKLDTDFDYSRTGQFTRGYALERGEAPSRHRLRAGHRRAEGNDPGKVPQHLQETPIIN